MSNQTLIARHDENILAGATVSGGSVMESYTLETLLTDDPAARVRFTDTSIDLAFALTEPQRGDIFVLPVHNFGGSVVVSISNGAGLNASVPVPAMRVNRIPRTIAVDLTAAEADASTRISSDWHLTVSGNAANVILGGAIYVFSQKRVLNPDIAWGFKQLVDPGVAQIQNDYKRRYRMNLRVQEETLDATTRTDATVAASLRDFFDANFGSALPGLFWPQLDETNALANVGPSICIWDGGFEAANVEGTELADIRLRLVELSKGKPV